MRSTETQDAKCYGTGGFAGAGAAEFWGSGVKLLLQRRVSSHF